MIREIEISVTPNNINNFELWKKLILKKIKIESSRLKDYKLIKKSIDARGKKPIYKLRIEVYIDEILSEESSKIIYKPVDKNKTVIIVGSGPAGLFAGLRLIEFGIKPIIFERGKDVRNRLSDLRKIQYEGIVNPESNYCFGEGGAGTYSDGKLYTRSKKRGDIKRITEILIQHGASETILTEAHPHIGSNRLPKIIETIRNTIQNCGGEIHFNSKVTDFILEEKNIKGVVVNNEKEIFSDAVILATGHSARDIYYLLKEKNIMIEPKPFAVGVRIEHPQELIDKIQYNSHWKNENLPAASYSLTCQVEGKGVYSFCMCPGGTIVPASTDNDELVLNGMSVASRNSPFANSGLVVSVGENDFTEFSEYGVFSGLEYQKEIERKVFTVGGGLQKAPAQRITDFLNNRISSSLPKSSYIPGSISAPLHKILPLEISKRLQKGIEIFGKRMYGFYTEEAQILAAETRTSSPIKIPRDKKTYEHIEIKNLYPAGEGAGYSGGIISAAIDGEKCAEAFAKKIK